ncbi:hypothetical protein BHQ15_00750 [Mycolicibacillus koreensis]|nr:hypothetical protein BHQ15_00750 [Mycolicibacillus koreensis]
MELTASPFDAYFDLFGNTVTDVQGLFNTVAANPFPILQQVFNNQVDSFQAIGSGLQTTVEALPGIFDPSSPASIFGIGETFFDQLLSGSPVEAFSTLASGALVTALPLLGAVTPLIDAIKMPVDNAAALVDTLLSPANALGLPLALLSPPLAGVLGTGLGLQNIVDAFGSGDPLGMVGSVAGFPGTVLNSVLNGYDISAGGSIGFGGLLGSVDFAGMQTPGGSIGAIQDILVGMAEAIGYNANDPLTASFDLLPESFTQLFANLDLGQFGDTLSAAFGSMDFSNLLGPLSDLLSPMLDQIMQIPAMLAPDLALALF